MPQFETQVVLACPPDALFDFLIRPKNVMTLHPPEMNVSLIEAPEIVEEGSQIRFQIVAFGYKQPMLHEIVNFRRPEGFLLREVEGVLKKFEHHHSFEANPSGGTLLVERIDYEPPGGMIGFLLSESKIREGMAKSFQFRHQELQRQFGQA